MLSIVEYPSLHREPRASNRCFAFRVCVHIGGKRLLVNLCQIYATGLKQGELNPGTPGNFNRSCRTEELFFEQRRTFSYQPAWMHKHANDSSRPRQNIDT